MLVSAVQWSESAIRIHLFPASWASLPPSSPPSHPPTSSQNIKWSSLCYTAASHYLSISHMVVHNGTPLQYSCLGNPMDGGAWWAVVHGVAKSWTWLSNFTFTFHFHALEKEMATRSSVLACRIPGMEEPGGLPSLGLHRVGHDWSDLAAATAVHICSILLFQFVPPSLPPTSTPCLWWADKASDKYHINADMGVLRTEDRAAVMADREMSWKQSV